MTTSNTPTEKTPHILVDNGYYKIESLEYALYNGITPVIPDMMKA